MNDYHGDYENAYLDHYPVEVECKFCGAKGLYWTQDDDGRWVLVTERYLVHKCDPKRVEKRTAEEFEQLDTPDAGKSNGAPPQVDKPSNADVTGLAPGKDER